MGRVGQVVQVGPWSRDTAHQRQEALRPCRAEDEQIRSAASAKVRRGWGPAPVQKRRACGHPELRTCESEALVGETRTCNRRAKAGETGSDKKKVSEQIPFLPALAPHSLRRSRQRRRSTKGGPAARPPANRRRNQLSSCRCGTEPENPTLTLAERTRIVEISSTKPTERCRFWPAPAVTTPGKSIHAGRRDAKAGVAGCCP